MNAPPALASTPRALDAPAASRVRRERRCAAQHLGAPRLGLRNRGSRVAPSARRLRDGLRAVQAANTTGENCFGYGERASESSIARDYDPNAGRWTARDPIGFAGHQQNLFAGPRDAINFTDPTGRGPELVLPICGPEGALMLAAGLLLAAVLDDLITLPKKQPANDNDICKWKLVECNACCQSSFEPPNDEYCAYGCQFAYDDCQSNPGVPIVSYTCWEP